MEQKLRGKRALVTGAGTGIGLEVAKEFARQGADVMLHYSHNSDRAESAVAEIASSGGKAAVRHGDFIQVGACFDIVDAAVEFMGGLDILVNNAGITEVWDFLEVTPEQYDLLYNVNIRGQFFCAQRAARCMLAQGGGAIINLASVHGLAGAPGHSVYAGTKGAICAWTRELAIELAPRNIRVNAIAPGWIEVESHHKKYDGYDPIAGGRQIPRRRVGQPIDIAKACVYLASSDGDFVVGHVLTVDGGSTALMSLAAQDAASL